MLKIFEILKDTEPYAAAAVHIFSSFIQFSKNIAENIPPSSAFMESPELDMTSTNDIIWCASWKQIAAASGRAFLSCTKWSFDVIFTNVHCFLF